MDKIIIGDFQIQEYDDDNQEHKSTMELLSNQEDFMYVGDLDYLEVRFTVAKNKGKPDRLYIAYMGDVPFGMIGSYLSDGSFYLLYAICPEFRGQNLASRLIGEYSRFLFTTHPEIDALRGFIHANNKASISCSRKAGFVPCNDDESNRTEYILRKL